MEISNMRALPYFDVNAETTLQTDASKKGLGACLIQKGKVSSSELNQLQQLQLKANNTTRVHIKKPVIGTQHIICKL